MLFKLLFSPFTAPPAGFRLLLNQMRSMAEAELYNVDDLYEELKLLQLRMEEGEITEEEYAESEAGVLARLRTAREYQSRRA